MDDWKQNLDFFFSGEGSLSKDLSLSLSDGSASPHKLRYRIHEEAVGKKSNLVTTTWEEVPQRPGTSNHRTWNLSRRTCGTDSSGGKWSHGEDNWAQGREPFRPKQGEYLGSDEIKR
jgi:hypothetical protein